MLNPPGSPPVGSSFDPLGGNFFVPDAMAQPDPMEMGMGALDFAGQTYQDNRTRKLPAIQIAPEEREYAKNRIKRYLDAARQQRAVMDEKVTRWRKYVRMDQRKHIPWKGAPNVTTPLVRQKTDGIEAHLAGALDLNPFFTGKPFSAEAQVFQQSFESAMEYEIARNDSRQPIFDAVQDAVICGTGHLKHVVRRDPTRDFLHPQTGAMVQGWTVAEEYVKFENIWVYPATITIRKRLAYFERKPLPYYEMEELADQGIFDAEMVQLVRSYSSPTRGGANEDDDIDRLAFSNLVDPGDRWHEILECYMRFDGAMWHVFYHEGSRTILAAQPYAWAQVFDKAPYQPVYIHRRAGFYYGDCVPAVLEALQELADAAFNSEIASGQFKMQPIMLARRGSIVARMLKSKQYRPGQVLEVDGPFDDYIKIVDFGTNRFNVELIGMLEKMSEDATFNDMTVPGATSGGRRTATEMRIIQTIGAMKLRQYLRTIRDSLTEFANDKWLLISMYVIAPRGIYKPYENSDVAVMGAQDISIISWDANGQQITTKIPGALREDMQFTVKGGDTVPDKEMRLQKYTELLQNVVIFQQARQDRATWELARTVLELNEVWNWPQIIGKEPPPEPDVLNQLVQQKIQEMIAQAGGQNGGNMGGNGGNATGIAPAPTQNGG